MSKKLSEFPGEYEVTQEDWDKGIEEVCAINRGLSDAYYSESCAVGQALQRLGYDRIGVTGGWVTVYDGEKWVRFKLDSAGTKLVHAFDAAIFRQGKTRAKFPKKFRIKERLP